MRDDIAALSDPSLVRRATTVSYYPSASPLDLIRGIEVETFDLSPFVASLSHTTRTADIRLAFSNTELSGAAKPRVGRLISIESDAGTLFRGIITRSSKDSEVRGKREFLITVRSRDSLPWFRKYLHVAPNVSAGADLGNMARDVALMLGLEEEEFDTPPIGVFLAHGQSQLADTNAWNMLEQILQPALLEPYVDVLGRLKYISRDMQRSPNITLDRTQIVSIDRGSSEQTVSAVAVRWLSPTLQRVDRENQVLATTQLTAGFWRPNTRVDVSWSQDRTLRADNVTMRIIDSINDLITFGDETFEQTSPFDGVVRFSAHPGSVFIGGAALTAAITLIGIRSFLPDNVIALGGGVTDPVGRIAEGVAIVAFLTIISHIGSGQYEIRGRPYDWVLPVNEATAIDENADTWETDREVIENDLIPNEDAAILLASNELVYRRRSAEGATLIMADDPRIERGDIIGLPGDCNRFYVLDYKRNLTRGAEATLECEGFIV